MFNRTLKISVLAATLFSALILTGCTSSESSPYGLTGPSVNRSIAGDSDRHDAYRDFKGRVWSKEYTGVAGVR